MMFRAADSFNQPLDNWNVSNVTRMNYMFEGAAFFSHYPESWVIPEEQSRDMFKRTKVAHIASLHLKKLEEAKAKLEEAKAKSAEEQAFARQSQPSVPSEFVN